MITESFLVPYQVSELPAGPWLVFAPHADDETFGMGGTLLRARDQGLRVELVIMTDGALGGSQADLVELRQQEVRSVAARLGIEALHFLQAPDRGLQVNVERVEQLRALIAGREPASVFFPGVYEPHPDHRSTALLVWAALQQLAAKPRALAYEISVQNPLNMLLDISAQMEEKCELMALYASQQAQNNYSDIVRAMNRLRTFSLPASVSYAEGFYAFMESELEFSLLQLMQQRLQVMLQV